MMGAAGPAGRRVRHASAGAAWLAVCTSLLGASAAHAAPKVGKLRAYETPGYTLIVTEGVDAGSVATDIANIERALARMLKREVRPTGLRTHVYVVTGQVWARYLRPGRAIIGEFVPRRFSNYLLLDATSARDRRHGMRHGIYHEYTHYFLHTQFRGVNPLWFDEGLASLMESMEMRPDGALLRLRREGRGGGWLRLSRLFELDKSSPEYLDADRSWRVHQQSWAIVHRGLIAEPQFGVRMLEFLAALDRLEPLEDAVQDSFGMSMAALDDSMREYLGRTHLDVGVVPVEPAPPVGLGSGRELSELDARIALARVMLDTGFNAPHARELVESAAALAPQSAEVAVLGLRLAVRERDDAGIDALLARTSLTDPRIARDVGVALIERVRAPAGEDLTPARRTLLGERALQLLHASAQAEDAEADWAFALSAAHLGRELDQALARLARAHVRVPDNADLSAATALVLEANGSPESMQPWLVNTYRFSADPAQRIWAAQRIAELRSLQRESSPQ